MVKIVGNELYRGGEKIGWMEDNKLFAEDGKKVGYFEDDDIFGADGRKVSYIDGDELYAEGSGVKIPLEKVAEDVTGGVVTMITRAAIYVLLGS